MITPTLYFFRVSAISPKRTFLESTSLFSQHVLGRIGLHAWPQPPYAPFELQTRMKAISRCLHIGLGEFEPADKGVVRHEYKKEKCAVSDGAAFERVFRRRPV